ncbi:MAG: SelT/SelW/SelH family protein [Deltaproteobacteria bacterium]|nr:MAG: SelT/SelW/SelH family protein [Deltaproteobacteria bacterium]
MAAAIQRAFPDAEVDLVKGDRGVFTVTVDGREIWNKYETGSFPNDDDIVAALRG